MTHVSQTSQFIKGYTRSLLLTARQNSFNACLSFCKDNSENSLRKIKVMLESSTQKGASTTPLHCTIFCEGQKGTVSPSWSEETVSLEPGLNNYKATECSGGPKIRLALTEYMGEHFKSASGTVLAKLCETCLYTLPDSRIAFLPCSQTYKKEIMDACCLTTHTLFCTTAMSR